MIIYYLGMKIDVRELIGGGFKKYADRKRHSLYFSDAVFQRFRVDVCGDVSASAVLEAIMERMVQVSPRKYSAKTHQNRVKKAPK